MATRKGMGYAMRVWCDVTVPMPAMQRLTIDDVVTVYHKVYRQIYGKPVPMEMGARIELEVLDMKADYSKQLRFKFLRKMRHAN